MTRLIQLISSENEEELMLLEVDNDVTDEIISKIYTAFEESNYEDFEEYIEFIFMEHKIERVYTEILYI